MFQRMDCQFLMTFKDNEIMSVALVVAEEEVLAMDRIYILPIFKSQFYSRERRMGMELIIKSVLLKKGKHFIYARVSCHLLRLLA